MTGRARGRGGVRLVGWLALFWNLVGVVLFLIQARAGPERLAAMSAGQRMVIEAMPASLVTAHALWVFGGVLAALALLLYRRWATTLFALSLLGAALQASGIYIHTPAWQLAGMTGLVSTLVPLAVSVALWWYARRALARRLLV